MDSGQHHASIGRDDLGELATDFTEIVKTLFAAGSVTDTLEMVVRLAVATIEGCDLAGLFMIDGGTVTTPVYSDPLVIEVDALQHLTSEGPCLDAIAHRLVFYAEDLDGELRWPHFAPQATSLGIRSMLAVPLAADARLGAVNLYARYPSAFGAVDRAKAAILASLAGQALSAAHFHEHEERMEANFNVALNSREIIGQAEGILMERERITADQAFDILRRASQHLNVKLREVAQNLVDTGESPDSGPNPNL